MRDLHDDIKEDEEKNDIEDEENLEFYMDYEEEPEELDFDIH